MVDGHRRRLLLLFYVVSLLTQFCSDAAAAAARRRTPSSRDRHGPRSLQQAAAMRTTAKRNAFLRTNVDSEVLKRSGRDLSGGHRGAAAAAAASTGPRQGPPSGSVGEHEGVGHEGRYKLRDVEGRIEDDGRRSVVRREQSNFVSLDSRGDFKLFWEVDDVTETIYFRVEANIDKKDLFAFGFSDYGEATDADFVVMWTGVDGKHKFQDMHTDKTSRLILDRQQDYDLDRVHVNKDGVLIVEFHRLYDTCDKDDYLIDTGTIHILFFTTAGVQLTVDGLDVEAVKPRLQRVQLLKTLLPDAEFPADTKTMVMHVDNVHVPLDETTYWCAVRKLPEMKDKHHIIQFEGAIVAEGIVHHLEVFHCQVPADVQIPFYDAPCSSNSEKPRGLESCSRVIGAWAMGANPLSYPAEAGVPVGGPKYSRYVMLEVHYNNPDHLPGIVDSSGIKFHYTSKLRRYDAGIMELGLEYTDKMALPPGLPLWKLNGYCIPECTDVSLPPDGINMFASQLHTHLTGLRAYTKHYRNGVELPELVRDNHYSPHYQEIRKLRKPVRILPGDALITTCEDQTIDRKEITLGGFSISDEMCVNYVHYYPLVDLEVCKSSVTTDSLYDFFRFMHDYQGERTSKGLGISDNYKSINWTPMNAHLLNTFYDTAPLSMQCNQSDGRKFPGEWENTHIPKILYPMPPEERPCLQ